MRTSHAARIRLALLLGLLASCSTRTRPEGPSVVLLTIDTLRADKLGCYGSGGGHTPNIDDLARRSVVFRRALAPIATTFPSHASMFTGVYPRSHGVRWNGDFLAEDLTTLAEILVAEGFATAAFASYGAMLARGGFDQGFDVVNVEKAAKGAARVSASEVNRSAFEYLDGLADGERSFVWLHYFEPHAPYPLTDYAREQMRGYEGPLSDGATVDEFYTLNRDEQRAREDTAAAIALYEGRVRDTDDLVGELLTGLEERGLLDNTIFVLVADHGQLLGEHGRVGHGTVLWEDALNVPFVIADPRATFTGEVQTRVGVIDLMPTVLELLSLESPPGMQGRSLASAMSGAPLTDQPYFAEMRIADPRQAGAEGQGDAVAALHGHHKLVLDGDDERLYDLATDPDELQPVPPGEAEEIVQRLRALARHHRELEVEAGESELTDAMMAELEALGYVDGDADAE